MSYVIEVLYDFSNSKNREDSIYIITFLANRGVAFDLAQKTPPDLVSLIMNGSIYTCKFIEEYRKDIERVISELKESGLVHMSS